MEFIKKAYNTLKSSGLLEQFTGDHWQKVMKHLQRSGSAKDAIENLKEIGKDKDNISTTYQNNIDGLIGDIFKTPIIKELKKLVGEIDKLTKENETKLGDQKTKIETLKQELNNLLKEAPQKMIGSAEDQKEFAKQIEEKTNEITKIVESLKSSGTPSAAA